MILAVILLFCPFALSTKLHGFQEIETLVINPPTKIFFEIYAQFSSPVLFKNVYVQPANNIWNYEYFYYNPGAAILDIPVSADKTVTLHQLLEYKKSIMSLNRTLPTFLRGDVAVPIVLDCDDLLTNYSHDPLWQFQVHDQEVKMHDAIDDELWCQVTGTRNVTMIMGGSPEDPIIDAWLPQKAIEADEKLKNMEFYEFHLSAGDCAYIPQSAYRQYSAAMEANTLIYSWSREDKIWEKPELFCELIEDSLRSLHEVYFVNQEDDLENFVNTWPLRHFIGYLPKKDHNRAFGYKKVGWVQAVKEDAQLEDGWTEELEALSGEMFDVLNLDKDELITWKDFTEEFFKVEAIPDLIEKVGNIAEKIQKVGLEIRAKNNTGVSEEGAVEDELPEHKTEL